MTSPPCRTLRVRHVTRYAYDAPVARSVHRLHVRPITDWRQRVLSHALSIDPDAPRVEYEDVFGNWSTRFELARPYTHQTRAQSDASHAWVQLYIPHIGWKDFDPTNGVLPQTDHVRVAYGRHYRDATPTTGTLYGHSRETMHIDVTVEDAAQLAGCSTA